MKKIKILGEKIIAKFIHSSLNNKQNTVIREYQCKKITNWLQIEANPIHFRKNWEPNPLPDEGGTAFLFHDGTQICLLSVMLDSDLFSNALPINDKTWEKGDVLEFFIQPQNSKEYYEIHLAPNFATLQLRIPGIEEFRSGKCKFEDCFCDLEPEFGADKIDLCNFKGWWGLICIDSAKIGANLNGGTAKFAICRYNYSKNKTQPECSSTAPLSKLSFHTPEEWQTMIFS